MAKYVCRACGYEYFAPAGDIIGVFAPKTGIDDLPDTWVCPVCGADRESFEKEEADF